MAAEYLAFDQSAEVVDVGGVHLDALLPNSDGVLVPVKLDGVLGRTVSGDVQVFPGPKSEFGNLSAKDLQEHFSPEDVQRLAQTMVSAAFAIAREKRSERGVTKKVA